MSKMQWTIAVLLCAVAGCKDPLAVGPPGPRGESGPKGDPGSQGEQGPPGVAVGWALNGNDLVTSNSGRLGVGTMAPQAALDVNGDLYVENDIFLLGRSSCRKVRLANPGTGDLTDQIQPYLSKYRCIAITLASGTSWTWNKQLGLVPYQTLKISGEGFDNDAQNITVTINMTQNDSFTYNGVTYRVPGRLFAPSYSQFWLEGVQLIESSNDQRPLSPRSSTGALFVAYGTSVEICLQQIRMTVSEDVVNLAERTVASIQFGHTFINKFGGAPRDPLLTKVYTGWDFGGGRGVVHRSHTTLGPGINYQVTPKSITTGKAGGLYAGAPQRGLAILPHSVVM